ncbi:Rv3654c family TadE-like protein [Asanoa sp. NPDC049518]|uniref:Rv3654c family TadE-like protein n=1 Tax=unclassified Asanoa TaxID=2685164 RepID=UPI0034486FA9
MVTAVGCSATDRPREAVLRDGVVVRWRSVLAHRDRGAATIWVLGVGLGFVLLGLACAAVGVAAIGRHQAQTAADLGALAGAARTLEGRDAACARAAEIVSANGGRMSGCVVQGLDVVVTVAVEVRLPPRGSARVATARARAGPVGWAP